MLFGVIIYPHGDPCGPPTLGQWLAARAVEYAADRSDPTQRISGEARAVREAMQIVLQPHIDAISDKLADNRRDFTVAGDLWHHHYWAGYTYWQASMTAALSMLDEIPNEPDFSRQ